jgi:protease IV
MKQFLTSMLGALTALLIFAFGGLLLCAGLVGALIAMGAKSTNVARLSGTLQPGSYLVFDLSANITDAPPKFDLNDWTGDEAATDQLRTVIRAIRTAAKDPDIVGILIKGSLRPAGYGSGFAALREVREALLGFRESGKPVKAYLTEADTRDYYVASAASEITLDPYGLIVMPGLCIEPMFFGGAAAKYGIGVQVTREGKYKSAVEPLIRSDMSPENRAQLQDLIDDIWGSLLRDISRARSVTPASIQTLVDTQGLIQAEAALHAKLVDKIGYRDQVIDELKAETGRTGSKEGPKQIGLAAYARIKRDPSLRASGGAVAVVYAEGEIVDGKGEAGQIGGTEFAREIRELRQNDDVKAIVLRVNSPGGSASASEDIQREIRLARAVKPVIVSMGSYAASGGYWISAYGDRIFAEPTTITGSIGVFGIQLNVQKLFGDWGITFDQVKTGKFADAMGIARPKTPEEMAVLQRLIDWIYARFLDKVAEGRHLDRSYVAGIAQGRVWSGVEAKQLHLVDELGGLSRAISYAAKKGGLEGSFRLIEYPQKKDLAEALGEFVGKMNPDTRALTQGLAGQVEGRIETGLEPLTSLNDPDGVYARLPLDLTLR